jgi:hypothetical protein
MTETHLKDIRDELAMAGGESSASEQRVMADDLVRMNELQRTLWAARTQEIEREYERLRTALGEEAEAGGESQHKANRE